MFCTACEKCECFVLIKNDLLKDNPLYVQFGCWCIQSNRSKLHSTNNFLHAFRVRGFNQVVTFMDFTTESVSPLTTESCRDVLSIMSDDVVDLDADVVKRSDVGTESSKYCFGAVAVAKID